MLIFLAFLMIGYAYVWVKGDLDWDRPEPTIPVARGKMPVPAVKTEEAVLS